MPATCSNDQATLAARCSGSARRQVSRCTGSRRVNHTSAGTSASMTRLLLHSQTTGSHVAKSSPARRTSINAVALLLAALIAKPMTQ